jgi:penicillin-binding protein 1A
MTSLSSWRSPWTRVLLVVVGLLAGVGVGGTAAFYALFLADLPDPHGIADYRPHLVTTVVDRNGQPVGEFFEERRRLVPLADVPKHVVDAFVSAEDRTFFEHGGIDFTSIARAAWKNLLAGGKVEGASTITQQMVKGLLLSPERTYTRKIREMILARRIEQRFTKQEILFLYLNQIYFGHGAYGIAEAARTYFGKPVGELSISEAAQLAGMPKAPSKYSPFQHPERAERRRRYVLQRMLEDGKIDESAHRRALAAPPSFTEGASEREFADSAYFTEEVRRFLFQSLGGDLVLSGGLRVETTLDASLQHTAVAAVRSGLEALDHREGYRGALRRVEKGAVEAEIAKLAQENGFAAPVPAGDTSAHADEPAAPTRDPAAAAAAGELDHRKLVGVVTHVDDQRARVSLAPDLRGEVALADAAWPESPIAQKKLGAILAVGDVVRFEVLPAAAKPDAPSEAGKAAKPAAPEPSDGATPRPLRLALFQEPKVEGALLSIEVASGDILALVGGYDFERSQFDRALQSRRQPGSAFKPLVYGTALSLADESGHPRYTPASIVQDRPKVYTDQTSGFVWKPENYEKEFYGPITLRKALAHSVNNATLQLCDEIGINTVIRYARRLGIRSPLEPYLSTALGTSTVSLLEMTRAYAVFPNGGRRVVPHFVRRVLDRDGNVLIENVPLGDPIEDAPPQVARSEPKASEDHQGGAPTQPAKALTNEAVDAAVETAERERANGAENAGGPPGLAMEEPADPNQILPPEQAYLVTDMLRAVVLEGTATRARSLGRPVAGKTGTTNDQADAWFIGFSPDVATGVWVGFDEVKFLGNGETGAHAALPIWVDYMRVALENRPTRDFPVPGNDRIVWARIDKETGLLASGEGAGTIFQSFIAGSEPTETADSARETNRAEQDLREENFSDGEAAAPAVDPDS